MGHNINNTLAVQWEKCNDKALVEPLSQLLVVVNCNEHGDDIYKHHHHHYSFQHHCYHQSSEIQGVSNTAKHLQHKLSDHLSKVSSEMEVAL